MTTTIITIMAPDGQSLSYDHDVEVPGRIATPTTLPRSALVRLASMLGLARCDAIALVGDVVTRQIRDAFVSAAQVELSDSLQRPDGVWEQDPESVRSILWVRHTYAGADPCA